MKIIEHKSDKVESRWIEMKSLMMVLLICLGNNLVHAQDPDAIEEKKIIIDGVEIVSERTEFYFEATDPELVDYSIYSKLNENNDLVYYSKSDNTYQSYIVNYDDQPDETVLLLRQIDEHINVEFETNNAVTWLYGSKDVYHYYGDPDAPTDIDYVEGYIDVLEPLGDPNYLMFLTSYTYHDHENDANSIATLTKEESLPVIDNTMHLAYAVSYDALGHLLNEESWEFVYVFEEGDEENGTEQWQGVSKTINEYTDGVSTSHQEFIWDAINVDFILDEGWKNEVLPPEEILEGDKNTCRISTNAYQVRDASLALNTQLIQTYDGVCSTTLGNLIEQIDKHWVGSVDVDYAGTKKQYAYDGSNVNQEIVYSWVNDGWMEKSMFESEYVSGKITKTSESIWDIEYGDWQIISQNTFTYMGDDLHTSSFRAWDYGSNALIGVKKEERLLDDTPKKRKTLLIKYGKESAANSDVWENVSKIEYVYSGSSEPEGAEGFGEYDYLLVEYGVNYLSGAFELRKISAFNFANASLSDVDDPLNVLLRVKVATYTKEDSDPDWNTIYSIN